MKKLNLVSLEQSDIKYKISKFPDGQQNIVINPKHLTGYFDSDGETEYWKSKKITKVQIKSRLNNWLDLELIVCAVASLRELGVEEIHLYTPYIMGARSDRKFEEGGNNYLRDVICPVINSLEFDEVTCLDPYSDVLEACIKGFRKESNINLIYFTMNQLRPLGIAEDYILISPDAGASKKIYKLAEQIGYKGDIITCSKERDFEGKLTKTVFPFETHKYNGEDFIIIDDICDGGQTFINIARKIKDCFAIRSANQNIKPGKIYLIVTHGIFSKGFGELEQYFDGIYCTNSYNQFSNAIVHDKGFVKQLNVF